MKKQVLGVLALLSCCFLAAGTTACGVIGGGKRDNSVDREESSYSSTVEVEAEASNFIAKPFNVNGDKFTLSNDVYTLVGQRGKPCVINFWETWCSACIQELHEFNQIQVDYGDKIDVVAIAGVTSTPEQLETWLSKKGWSKLDEHNDWATFSLTFAYLPSADCKKMGCSGFLPRTVIVDKEGVVVHEQDGSMTYEALDEILKEIDTSNSNEENTDDTPIERGYTFKLLKADGSPAAGYQIQICKEDNSICLAPVVVAANGVANVVVENKTIPYVIHILDESYAAVEGFDGMSVIPANYDGGVIELKLK